MARLFLTARWENLAILNYRIAPGVLRGMAPAGTELDEFEGMTLVSVVGFHFGQTRVCGVAVPGHHDFEEVNLRFYVRRRVEGSWRRGVVFVKEIVPLRAVAAVARMIYGEKYCRMPMRREFGVFDATGVPTRVSYGWRRGRTWEEVRLAAGGEAFVPAEGSHESFIVDHSWGYTSRRNGKTAEYRVERPPWRVRRAIEATLECDAAALYGDAFAEALREGPVSALLAEGSEVRVYWGRVVA